jgi:hypothetical protein
MTPQAHRRRPTSTRPTRTSSTPTGWPVSAQTPCIAESWPTVRRPGPVSMRRVNNTTPSDRGRSGRPARARSCSSPSSASSVASPPRRAVQASRRTPRQAAGRRRRPPRRVERTGHLSAPPGPLAPQRDIDRPRRANRVTVTVSDLGRQPLGNAARWLPRSPRGHHAIPHRSGSPRRSGTRPGPRPGCQLHTDSADRRGSRATGQLPIQRRHRPAGRTNPERLPAHRLAFEGVRPSIASHPRSAQRSPQRLSNSPDPS